MSRRALLDMLDHYRHVFPDEGRVVDRICRLVEAHADCFERSCRPGHITGAAWVASADRRRFLLAHHRKLDRWLQLGGHADGHACVDEVALREAREESGLAALDILPVDGAFIPFDLDVHEIPPRYDAHGRLVEDAHEHYDIRFLVIARSAEPPSPSDESHAVGWFTPEEIFELTDEESVLRMLRKSLELLS
jgi:8-oxo-dGTP pyrophosphatase MutT (NUDIX family)